MTAMRIAAPSSMSDFFGSNFGIQSANNLINQLGLGSVNAGEERTGDIIRWGTGGKTHFANVIFTDDDGITQVFSRTGVSGTFEIVPLQTSRFPTSYGPITGEFRPKE
jgi:hypothetical protein